MLKSFISSFGLLLTFTPSLAQAVAITFDNGGANQVWSNAANFGGTPASGNDVTFNNTASAGASGTVTNIVDSSVTVASLAYRNDSNASNFHTTQINSNQTLSVNGPLTVGLTTGSVGTNVVIKGDTSGQGTLSMTNSASNFTITSTPSTLTNMNLVLDMKDLGNFNANVNQFDVYSVFSWGLVTLNMAQNNSITANEVKVGTNPWGGTVTMNLGQTNTINANSIGILHVNPQSGSSGSFRGAMQFRSGLTNPSVTFRDKLGTGRADLTIGARHQDSGSNPGILDLNGGTVDGLFNTVRLGVGVTTSGAGSNQNKAADGRILFNGGTIDATTITMAEANTGSLPSSFGSITIGSQSGSVFGTLIADTINMTHRPAGTAGATTATINLNGGMLRATTIQRGAALGSGASTVNFNFNSGTFSHKAGADGSVSVNVPVNILTSGAHNFSADAGRELVINSAVQGTGTGAVNKIGDGSVLMLGTNTYVAPTNVLAGTLGGTGSSTSDFTVASGATLAPGASAGTLLTDDLTMQSGSTLEIEIGGLTAGTQYDQVISSGAINLSGNLIVKLIEGFSPTSADSFTILQGLSVMGEFDSVTLVGGSGLGFFDVTYLNNQVLLSNFHVPEPSSLSLVGMATFGLIGWRRRNRRIRERAKLQS